MYKSTFIIMTRLFEYEPVKDGMGLSDIERFGGFLDLMNRS